MTKHDGPPDEGEGGGTVYEVEVDGHSYQVDRALIEALAREIAGQPGDLDDRLRTVFADHPAVDFDATEDAEPIGTEPEADDEPQAEPQD